MLEREIADYKEGLEGNKVFSDEDNIAPTPHSAKADKSEDKVEERLAKKLKKLQQVTTSKMMDQRA